MVDAPTPIGPSAALAPISAGQPTAAAGAAAVAISGAGVGAGAPMQAPGARLRSMRRRHRLRRLVRAVIAASVVWIGALVAGFVLNGLGVGGIIAAVFAAAIVFALFLIFPRMRMPAAADLTRGDVASLAGRTQLYLDGRRAALPAPAQAQLDRIALGLDQLAPQLATIADHDPAADNARRLLGEHLPGLIDSYTRIPAGLRGASGDSGDPGGQLSAGLGIIAREIDAMAGDIARGDLDALATRGRYLETKYAGDV